MNSIKEKLENWIKETLGEVKFVLEHSTDLSRGDFTLILNQNAEEAIEKLEAKKLPEIEKIELVNKRFINIFLSKVFFSNSLGDVLREKEKFGQNDDLKGKKIIVEFTDPNPFKEFHIGHIMPNSIGESISRLLQNSGAEVKRANYQGDVGLHVAKAIWARDKKPTAKWGGAYAYGAQHYEQHKEEIAEINKKIYEKSDEGLNKLYQEGRQESLDEFEKIYKIFGTKFDYYFFESEVEDFGKEIVLEFLKKGVFEESDGAIIFRGEKYDPKLHTRVFINSKGIPVYEAKELGLAKIKYDKFHYDKSIVVTGNEIKEYFKVLLAAMKAVYPELAEKTLHVPHGMLRLPSGKMSSRTGEVITADWLISEVKEKIKEKLKERDFSEEEKEEIAEMVAIGAIKYSVLRQSVGGDIVFDINKSISFEGDSGPYLQYTSVRANSVIHKAKEEKIKAENEISDGWEITELEKLLYRFPEVVERATDEYSPHYLVTYLLEIAGSFNTFYAQNKIVDPGSKEVSAYRLALTEAVYTVLANGLYLLGIKIPPKM